MGHKMHSVQSIHVKTTWFYMFPSPEAKPGLEASSVGAIVVVSSTTLHGAPFHPNLSLVFYL